MKCRQTRKRDVRTDSGCKRSVSFRTLSMSTKFCREFLLKPSFPTTLTISERRSRTSCSFLQTECRTWVKSSPPPSNDTRQRPITYDASSSKRPSTFWYKKLSGLLESSSKPCLSSFSFNGPKRALIRSKSVLSLRQLGETCAARGFAHAGKNRSSYPAVADSSTYSELASTHSGFR